MNVQLVSIKTTPNPRLYQIEVLIGELQHQFAMTVESFTVANREIQVTNGDDTFSQVFRFNQIIANNICHLVANFHNHQPIQLPREIGEFHSNKLESITV